MAVGCEPFVCSAEDRTRARNEGQSKKRPRPPNVFGQKNQRVSAGEIAPIGCEDAHGIKEFAFRYIEALANPRRLEGSEVETAARQNRLDASDPAATQDAVAVIKHPASQPRVVTYLCNFRIHRISQSKFFTTLATFSSCHLI